MIKEYFKQGARWLLWLTLMWLLVRGGISVVLPAPAVLPSPSPVTMPPSETEQPEVVLQALLFARQYLTWDRDHAQSHAEGVAKWMVTETLATRNVSLDDSRKNQTVRGVWPYRVGKGPRQIVQVLAEVVTTDDEQEDPPELILIAVPVEMTENGPVITDLPFFLPPPPITLGPPPSYPSTLHPDTNGEVQVLLSAFFKAYGEGGDTRFFTAPGAPIMGFPKGMLELLGAPTVRTYSDGDNIVAVTDIRWRDLRTGAEFRQRYLVELIQHDRWLVSKILGEELER